MSEPPHVGSYDSDDMTRCRRIPKSGFTLVELLVVIAIIAILASLLLSGLSRAKQAADNAFCRNNLRQQAIALTMYVGDSGAYPLYATPRDVLLFRRMWVHLLEPFARDKWPGDNDGGSFIFRSPGRGVFACPGYNKVRGLYKNYVDGLEGAYAYNAPSAGLVLPAGRGVDLYGLGSSIDPLLYPAKASLPGVLRPISESEVVSPSQMIAIGDSEIVPFSHDLTTSSVGKIWLPFLTSNLMIDEQLADFVGAPILPLTPSDKAMVQRHGGRWNMVFCDGHSENGKMRRFFKFTDDNVVRLWNRDNQPHRKQ